MITFTKKALQMFCATNKCDRDLNKWCFLLKWMVTKKMCDTNKNVTKMSMIIKGVCCILVFSFFPSPFPLGFLLFSFIKFGMGSSHRHNHNASKQMILWGVRISDILKEKIKENFVKEKGISEKL